MLGWKVNVKGRVQGVGFRYTTQLLAIRLGLTGSVKNLSDGSVELDVFGGEDRFRELIEILKEEFSLGDNQFKIESTKISLPPESFDILSKT